MDNMHAFWLAEISSAVVMDSVPVPGQPPELRRKHTYECKVASK